VNGSRRAVLALRSNDKDTQANALEHLAKTAPDARLRDEVVKALNPILENTELIFPPRDPALKTAAKWGSKDNVPSLIQVLDLPQQSQADSRRLAMVALVAIKDERAIWPIGRRLTNLQDKAHAIVALTTLGPTVEKVAKDKITDPAPITRNEAWLLLGLCGSKANLASYKAVADLEGNALVKQNAINALAQIKSR
jgi:hypothetical protein